MDLGIDQRLQRQLSDKSVDEMFATHKKNSQERAERWVEAVKYSSLNSEDVKSKIEAFETMVGELQTSLQDKEEKLQDNINTKSNLEASLSEEQDKREMVERQNEELRAALHEMLLAYKTELVTLASNVEHGKEKSASKGKSPQLKATDSKKKGGKKGCGAGLNVVPTAVKRARQQNLPVAAPSSAPSHLKKVPQLYSGKTGPIGRQGKGGGAGGGPQRFTQGAGLKPANSNRSPPTRSRSRVVAHSFPSPSSAKASKNRGKDGSHWYSTKVGPIRAGASEEAMERPRALSCGPSTVSKLQRPSPTRIPRSRSSGGVAQKKDTVPPEADWRLARVKAAPVRPKTSKLALLTGDPIVDTAQLPRYTSKGPFRPSPKSRKASMGSLSPVLPLDSPKHSLSPPSTPGSLPIRHNRRPAKAPPTKPNSVSKGANPTDSTLTNNKKPHKSGIQPRPSLMPQFSPKTKPIIEQHIPTGTGGVPSALQIIRANPTSLPRSPTGGNLMLRLESIADENRSESDEGCFSVCSKQRRRANSDSSGALDAVCFQVKRDLRKATTKISQLEAQLKFTQEEVEIQQKAIKEKNRQIESLKGFSERDSSHSDLHRYSGKSPIDALLATEQRLEEMTTLWEKEKILSAGRFGELEAIKDSLQSLSGGLEPESTQEGSEYSISELLESLARQLGGLKNNLQRATENRMVLASQIWKSEAEREGMAAQVERAKTDILRLSFQLKERTKEVALERSKSQSIKEESAKLRLRLMDDSSISPKGTSWPDVLLPIPWGSKPNSEPCDNKEMSAEAQLRLDQYTELNVQLQEELARVKESLGSKIIRLRASLSSMAKENASLRFRINEGQDQNEQKLLVSQSDSTADATNYKEEVHVSKRHKRQPSFTPTQQTEMAKYCNTIAVELLSPKEIMGFVQHLMDLTSFLKQELKAQESTPLRALYESVDFMVRLIRSTYGNEDVARAILNVKKKNPAKVPKDTVDSALLEASSTVEKLQEIRTLAKGKGHLRRCSSFPEILLVERVSTGSRRMGFQQSDLPKQAFRSHSADKTSRDLPPSKFLKTVQRRKNHQPLKKFAPDRGRGSREPSRRKSNSNLNAPFSATEAIDDCAKALVFLNEPEEFTKDTSGTAFLGKVTPAQMETVLSEGALDNFNLKNDLREEDGLLWVTYSDSSEADLDDSNVSDRNKRVWTDIVMSSRRPGNEGGFPARSAQVNKHIGRLQKELVEAKAMHASTMAELHVARGELQKLRVRAVEGLKEAKGRFAQYQDEFNELLEQRQAKNLALREENQALIAEIASLKDDLITNRLKGSKDLQSSLNECQSKLETTQKELETAFAELDAIRSNKEITAVKSQNGEPQKSLLQAVASLQKRLDESEKDLQLARSEFVLGSEDHRGRSKSMGLSLSRRVKGKKGASGSRTRCYSSDHIRTLGDKDLIPVKLSADQLKILELESLLQKKTEDLNKSADQIERQGKMIVSLTAKANENAALEQNLIQCNHKLEMREQELVEAKKAVQETRQQLLKTVAAARKEMASWLDAPPRPDLAFMLHSTKDQFSDSEPTDTGDDLTSVEKRHCSGYDTPESSDHDEDLDFTASHELRLTQSEHKRRDNTLLVQTQQLLRRAEEKFKNSSGMLERLESNLSAAAEKYQELVHMIDASISWDDAEICETASREEKNRRCWIILGKAYQKIRLHIEKTAKAEHASPIDEAEKDANGEECQNDQKIPKTTPASKDAEKCTVSPDNSTKFEDLESLSEAVELLHQKEALICSLRVNIEELEETIAQNQQMMRLLQEENRVIPRDTLSENKVCMCKIKFKECAKMVKMSRASLQDAKAEVRSHIYNFQEYFRLTREDILNHIKLALREKKKNEECEILMEELTRKHSEIKSLNEGIELMKASHREKVEVLQTTIKSENDAKLKISDQLHRLRLSMEMKEALNAKMAADIKAAEERLNSRRVAVEKMNSKLCELNTSAEINEEIKNQLLTERELNSNLQAELLEFKKRSEKSKADLQHNSKFISTQKDTLRAECERLEVKIRREQENYDKLNAAYIRLHEELAEAQTEAASNSRSPLTRKLRLSPSKSGKRKRLEDLEVNEVCQLLQRLKLDKYSEAFKQSDIDGTKLAAFAGSVHSIIKMDEVDANTLKGYLIQAKESGIDDSQDSACSFM